jgi:hypothetical protein
MRLFRPAMAIAITVAAVAVDAGRASANYVIDLMSAGAAPVTYQGAIFAQSSQQPTGTGVFNPFVRIQMNGTEAGYNTDARPVEFQNKDQNQWTHSLSLSSLAPVTINGTQYYQFALDINEQGNTNGAKLSMDDFQIYLGNSGSLTGFNDGFGSNAVKVYDIDAGQRQNATVNLNAALNPPGSGVADLNVYVPVSLFAGFGSQFQFVYLYSAFGKPFSSGAGFEEWAALQGPAAPVPPPPPPPSGVPAPGGVVLGLLGIGCLCGRSLRRRTADAAGG